jgi:putative ABC transport system substrate-binding protein
MRTRRELFLAFGVLAAAAPFRSLAQKDRRVRRVGFLASRKRDDPSYPHFAAALRDLGYVEGKDLAIEWRFAEGYYERLPALAKELVDLPVDVVVTDGTPGIRAAQAATRTIPIIFGGGADLVESGLVKSLARPGGNTTGASLLLSDTTGKQLELVNAILPRLSRVAILFNPANQAALSLLHGFEAASAGAKIRIAAIECRTTQEIEGASARIAEERSEALVWVVDSFLIQEQRRIADLALRLRLPSVSGHPGFPDVGGLVGYGPNRKDLWIRVASYVDKVLKGADPAELPVQQPTKLDLVLSRKTARALGVDFPPELLVLADRVIE